MFAEGGGLLQAQSDPISSMHEAAVSSSSRESHGIWAGQLQAADTSSQFVGAIVLSTIRYQNVHSLVGLLGDLHINAWHAEPGSRAEAASGHVSSRA